MGDMADFYSYQIQDNSFVDFTKWETKNGEVYNITDMTSDHIRNCIKMLEKEIAYIQSEELLSDIDVEVYSEYIRVFNEELDKRYNKLKEKEIVAQPQDALLITASLLDAWKYLLNSEYGNIDDFLNTLKRVPSETTEAQQKGFDFENWAIENYTPTLNGQYQIKASRNFISRSKTNYLVYGRLDCLKCGKIYDYKHTSKYEVGKFYGKCQTSVYLYLIPEANEMEYIIATTKPNYQLAIDKENGINTIYNIYNEVYQREDVKPIEQIIEDFESWLKNVGLWETYKKYWGA